MLAFVCTMGVYYREGTSTSTGAVLIIGFASEAIENKLAERNITLDDVIQCFNNRSGKFLIDDREEHKTDPPTLWFISTTDVNRTLKVVFMYFADNQEAHVKSAYDANSKVVALYEKLK